MVRKERGGSISGTALNYKQGGRSNPKKTGLQKVGGGSSKGQESGSMLSLKTQGVMDKNRDLRGPARGQSRS